MRKNGNILTTWQHRTDFVMPKKWKVTVDLE